MKPDLYEEITGAIRDIRKVVGVILIIAGWLDILWIAFGPIDLGPKSVISIIALFGFAWLVLPKSPSGDHEVEA